MGAISRIPGLLEIKVNDGEMLPFAPFFALALSCTMLPTCMEKLVAGLSVMVAGKGEGPGGLALLQAGKNMNKELARPTHAREPKRNLPMHPLVASRWYPMGALFKWNGKLVV